MIIRNATKAQLFEAVREAANDYEGNVRFKNGPDAVNSKGTGHRLTLTVNKSAGPGGRRSATGRKVAAACWHVHREFMRAVYRRAPEAVIITALARYEDAQDFEEKFTATGHGNIGSAAHPQSMRNACECHDDDDEREDAEQAAWEEGQKRMRGFVDTAQAELRKVERAQAKAAKAAGVTVHEGQGESLGEFANRITG